MKVIATRKELLALLDAEGKLREPARLMDNRTLYDLTSITSLSGLVMGERCSLSGLTSITSLSGLVMGELCSLYGLTSVTSLSGLVMGDGCSLSGLTSITSLSGLVMGDGCSLYDLSDNVEIEADPSPKELDILRRIPIEDLNMSVWHCGTSHCLAGWAQVLEGDTKDCTAREAGQRLLPSMAPYFFAPQESVVRFLTKIQSPNA